MSLATRIAQEFNNVRSHISGITAYHLLGGNLSVSNEVITNGFSTTLYTGNGGTQNITTSVDMATQHGDDVSETYGGLSWVKSRSIANGHQLYDTVRGATKVIYSQLNNAEATEVTGLTSFNNNGFTIGSLAGVNQNASNQVSWNFQTTHRRTGVTNHGKAYTEHYNPFTGFTIIKYEGSGIAGHEIPHMLGRKLGFVTFKNLTVVENWIAQYEASTIGLLNLTNAFTANTLGVTNFGENSVTIGTSTAANTLNQQYIMYGWANSYFDETNKLIGNYEIGVYQGTGAAGNRVTTRGKPAWIMIKRLDSIADWFIIDNMRGDNSLLANTSGAENSSPTAGYYIDFVQDGFVTKTLTSQINTSGGQYLYMVVYDNDSGSGKSKYPRATETSNVQINNALIPLAHGIDSNGSKNSIVIANETITGLTYTQGKNYLYKTDTGYGVKHYEPRYLSSDLVRRFAGEQPDYFDVNKNKWFNTDAGTELVTNGTFSGGVTTGWTALAPSTISISNGTLLISRVSNAFAYYTQTLITTVIGKKYKARCYYSCAGQFILNASSVSYGENLVNFVSISGSSGVAEIEFVAQTTATYIVIGSSGLTSTANIDAISVFEADIFPTTEITESRNYLNHIVHADQNGQVAYVEELPKITYFDRIETSGNRIVMYLEDYGISQIQADKRYIVRNPFGNENAIDCDVKAEVFIGNLWGEAGWGDSYGATDTSVGTVAIATSIGIVLQTGVNAVTYNGNKIGSAFPSVTPNLVTAKCRVIITYKGKTRGQK